jgi:hypothetical protein
MNERSAIIERRTTINARQVFEKQSIFCLRTEYTPLDGSAGRQGKWLIERPRWKTARVSLIHHVWK